VKRHKDILNLSKKFIKDGALNNKNVSYNPNYFLSSWSDTIGYLNLKKFSNQRVNHVLKSIVIFKEVFAINRDSIEYDGKTKLNKYENVVMSYFVPENLKKNGSYFDKYFSMNTDIDNKTLWVLIPSKKDNNIYKTKKNLIILNRNSYNFYFNIFFSTYIYFKNFILSFFFTNIHYLKLKETNFSKNLYEIINFIISKHKIKKLIFPYEAQPHQHYLIKKLKKKNLKLKTIGYMHTVIPPLPLDYIKRPGHPDLVYVNGYSQKKIMCEKLGWKKREVKNIVSFRYKKTIKNNLNNIIFLPYFLENEDKIFNLFKNLIYSKPKEFFPKFNIKNHPSMESSKKHLKLIKKLRLFLNEEKNFFKNKSSNKKISVFIGSTASVAEGLERGLRVFHICSDPILEKFDKFYWDSIKNLYINENIFEYKLKNKGSLIKFSNSNRKFVC